MSLLDSIDFPSSSNVDVRIAWAGDRFQDLLEGMFTVQQGWFIHTAIMGWADLCTSNERRQYFAMAKIFEEYLRNQ